MIKVSNLKIEIDFDNTEFILNKISKKLKIDIDDIEKYKIIPCFLLLY